MQIAVIRALVAFFVFVWSGWISAHAQESRLETQLIRCSAITTIFSLTAEKNSPSEKKLKKISTIFFDVYANEKKSKSKDIKKEDVEERRQQILNEIKEYFGSRENLLMEEGVICGAWGEGFWMQGDDYSFIPVYPKVISSQIRDEYAHIVSVAFKQWLAQGAPMAISK